MNIVKSFWVTNACNRNVSLSDLNLTINAFSSVNLLDKKHYSYNENQLISSAKSGSIFKKRNKIFIRNVAPDNEKIDMLFNREGTIPSRERSVLTINEQNFEELDVVSKNKSDEAFALENADIIDMDSKPLFQKEK